MSTVSANPWYYVDRAVGKIKIVEGVTKVTDRYVWRGEARMARTNNFATREEAVNYLIDVTREDIKEERRKIAEREHRIRQLEERITQLKRGLP